MPPRHVIVDGSNLATEGRSLPSLAQLDQAVREYLAENPTDVVTVVVDASFGHRIDPSEVPVFEEAEAAGELVSPPAGAIGRGDAFLLRIADKAGATVLSNDSFQEFHGVHPWLFDDGRLVGGKPVPGVGWIFLPRTPVRGQRSREGVKDAKRRKGAGPTTHQSGLDLAASKAKGRAKKVDRAIARATEEAVEPKAKGERRRRAAGVPPAEPLNEPLAFITFIAAHPLGSEVAGTVLEFSSHGAFVNADGARCYVPLSAMGDPPPRRAREVVAKGEERSFVVQALDPQRRGVELALPDYARVAGGPTEETVEAEIHPRAEATPKRRRRDKAEAATVGATPLEVETAVPALVGSPPVPDPTDGSLGQEAVAAVAAARPARRAAGRKAASAPARNGGAANVEADRPDNPPGAPVAVKESARKRAPAVKKAAAAEPGPPTAPAAKKAAAKKAGVAEHAGAGKSAPAGATATNAAAPSGATAAKRAVAKRTGAPARAMAGKEAPAGATAAKKVAKRAAAPTRATAAGKLASAAKAATAKATPAKKASTAKQATAKPATTRKTVTKKAAPLEDA